MQTRHQELSAQLAADTERLELRKQTFTCPTCKTEIKLTESLAAPLIESTRRQFEQQLAQKTSR